MGIGFVTWNVTFRTTIAIVVITYIQWLKCNGTQGNAVPPLPIYGFERSPYCYSANKKHSTTDRGPNLNVPFPTSNFAL